MTTTELDARYGRTPERRRRGRLLAIAAGIATALVLAAWLAWAGVLVPAASLESRTLGRDLVEGGVLVRFEVTATPGSEVVCALEAQNAQRAIVGWRVVELPASEERTRRFEQLVLTSEPADIGLLNVCRLT